MGLLAAAFRILPTLTPLVMFVRSADAQAPDALWRFEDATQIGADSAAGGNSQFQDCHSVSPLMWTLSIPKLKRAKNGQRECGAAERQLLSTGTG